MTSIFGLDTKEAVRIKVKKCDGSKAPEYKSLCVDPQITSFDTLRHLLAKAFNIKSDFVIYYVARDDRGQDVHLSMLSDWDLDAAFFGSSDPHLKLKVDLKPFEEGIDDDGWDLVAQNEEQPLYRSSGNFRLPVGPTSTVASSGNITGGSAASGHVTSGPGSAPSTGAMASSLMQTQIFSATLGNMSSQLRETMVNMSKIVRFSVGKSSNDNNLCQLNKKPMNDAEFHTFMNTVGELVRPQDFRLNVYQGGIEHSLRKVAWRHLLNVYPESMTGQQRFDYLKRKCSEYYALRDEWLKPYQKRTASEEVENVAHMVRKDVLRTDRTHDFFSGSDDNNNTTSLFHMLTTYALTHPNISYCQGMSDLASPVLFVQNDEAHAYICFCGLMNRLRPNFNIDGIAMTTMFKHLSLLLRHHDPDFYGYLKEHKADDLFFCYRWLLLELKREFPFADALQMLEIMWSSLQPNPPEKDIELADPVYFSMGLGRLPTSPSFKSGLTAYDRLRALRQRSTEDATKQQNTTKEKEVNTVKQKETPQPATPQIEASDSSSNDFLTINSDDLLVDLASEVSIETNQPVNDAKSSHIVKTPTIPADKNPPRLVSATQKTSVQSSHAHTNNNKKDIAVASNKPVKTVAKKGPGKAQKCSGDQMPGLVENHYDAEEEYEIDTSKDPHFNRQRPNNLKPGKPAMVARQISDNGPPVRLSSKGLVIEEGGVSEKSMHVSASEEAAGSTSTSGSLSIGFVSVEEKLSPLPPPQQFGNSNPFLMFMCLALLSLHRDHVIKNHMDYNDMAMFFDKMVRKHDVTRVLYQAQAMYASYLKQQQNTKGKADQDRLSV